MKKYLKPEISIIIPTYNREQYIRETLRSVESQSYNNWECLVIDDGSADSTVAIIKEFSEKDNRFRFYTRDRSPKGANTCRNLGIEKSKGKFVIFLDSDDLLMAHCLESRIKYFSKNLDFAVFPISIEENPLSPVFDQIWLDRGRIFKDDLTAFLLWSQWQTMSVLWKKESLLSLGGFHSALRSSQDGFLHRDALIERLRYEVLRDVKVDAIYRKNQDSITANIDSEKIHSRFLSFKWNYQKMLNYNMLQKTRKALILGQFLFCLKELSKLNEVKKVKCENEIQAFIFREKLISHTGFNYVNYFIFRARHKFARKLLKRFARFFISKYSLWKL